MDPASNELVLPIEAAGGAVPKRERIVAIDVLRGFALLGILAMNIQSFSMIGSAYVNPTAYGDLTGANYWVWWACHVFADQKFMSIFSMLFGAGIVLMTGRQEDSLGRSARVHYRRMGILLCFGLLHAYLVWYGDILVAYALCGMVAYIFRRLPPWVLLLLGLIAIAIHSLIYFGIVASIPHWTEHDREGFRNSMQPGAEAVLKELEVVRGGWVGQLRHRAPVSFFFETFLFAISIAWRAGGLMLFGMGLFKLGFFSAMRSARTYWIMVIGGLAIGLPVIIYGHQTIVERNWEPFYAMFAGSEYNYWGSFLVSLAYIGAVMLACQQPALNVFTRPLAAVGQMALTNYLMQSIICTTIFYGHGFGYFGYVERVGQLGVVIAIWMVQLIISPIWLSYFRFGPAEWLWRTLTYGRRP